MTRLMGFTQLQLQLQLQFLVLVAVGGVGTGVACDAPSDIAANAPMTLVAERTTLEANGVDSLVLTATAPSTVRTTGGQPVVVSFTSTGGLLSSSSAVPDENGIATVVLRADREDALLGRPEKPVTVRASITRSLQDVETATLDVVFVTPTTGAPSLSISADPPAAIADGATQVTLTIGARRLAAGTTLTIVSTAGTLSTSTVALDGETATATLTAPSSPADAIVTVREPGGVTATTTVAFVEDGAAQFDLTGTFAQMAPARVRLRAGTLTPNPQCIVAPAFVKVDIVQTGDAIEATYTTCFVTLAPVRSIVGEVTNEAPPAFVGSIPQVHAVMTLADVALGALFDPPQSVVVSGAELDDPDDELPTSEDDDRVRDSDGDGRPGVTVVNSLGGEQNITFRNTGDTVGVIESSNRIVGSTEGDMFALPESSVLGAGDAFIPEMESIPSVFEMVRVDGQHGAPDMDTNGDGTVSCNEIVDAADFLFTLEAPPTPLDCAGVP